MQFVITTVKSKINRSLYANLFMISQVTDSYSIALIIKYAVMYGVISSTEMLDT